MVYSNINNTVFYKEDKTIDTEDIGYESTLFEMEIYGKKIFVVFGKIKYTFIQRNIVYAPVYLVVYDKVKTQIGILEFTKNEVLDILDDDQDIMVDKINSPITFGFFDETFVDSYGSISKKVDDKDFSETKDVELESEVIVDEIDEDETFLVKVKPSEKSQEIKASEKKLEKGVFLIDKTIKLLPDLTEETIEIAKQQKNDFEGSPTDNWLCTYFKNSFFEIHDVERNGDCFFGVIRDAFKQIGHITTVSKLRAILAKELTEDVFNEHRELYTDLAGTINEYNRKLSIIKDTLEKDLNLRAKKAKNNKFELRSILNEISQLKITHKALLQNKQSAQAMINEDVGEFKLIDTIEKFREFIQTSGFWANSWAISTLEKVLNVKFIILSERAYIENDLHNVLICGEANLTHIEKKQFTPEHYITTTFSGNHYQLIEYKKKRIVKFFELSYYIKTLILNKCLEKNSGSFYLINDFKDLKTQIGIDDDENDDDGDELHNSELYDNNTVFTFYRNSNNTSKPGKGTNEKIPNDKRSQFIDLSKISNWRRKLDDTWSDAPFSIDNKKWLSVEHYYQSSKFKKHNPDFASLFSIDNISSEIAKDVDLAMSAGSKNGRANSKAKGKFKEKDTLLRPKNIDIDPDFYGERSDQERELALVSKFEQNEDLKLLLLSTKNAKLIHYIHGAPGEKDTLLMNVRHKLSTIDEYVSR